jgi:hypothetical protein
MLRYFYSLRGCEFIGEAANFGRICSNFSLISFVYIKMAARMTVEDVLEELFADDDSGDEDFGELPDGFDEANFDMPADMADAMHDVQGSDTESEGEGTDLEYGD